MIDYVSIYLLLLLTQIHIGSLTTRRWCLRLAGRTVGAANSVDIDVLMLLLHALVRSVTQRLHLAAFHALHELLQSGIAGLLHAPLEQMTHFCKESFNSPN